MGATGNDACGVVWPSERVCCIFVTRPVAGRGFRLRGGARQYYHRSINSPVGATALPNMQYTIQQLDGDSISLSMTRAASGSAMGFGIACMQQKQWEKRGFASGVFSVVVHSPVATGTLTTP